MRSLALLALMSGCISVSDHALGSNRYMVEAEGRPRHSLGDVIEAARERAAELCGRYTVVDTQTNRDESRRRTDVVLTVECGP